MTHVPADASDVPAVVAVAAEPEASLTEPSAPAEAPVGEFAVSAGEERPNLWADDAEQEEEAFHIKKAAIARDDLDMTSLVDICFLLLVFFMITASFTVQKSLQVAAPEADDAAASSAPVVSVDDIVGESIVVEVDDQDRIRVEDVAVTGITQLKEVLLQKRESEQKTDVLIEAAYNATHGTVVEVTDAAIAVGMQKVRRASRSNDD